MLVSLVFIVIIVVVCNRANNQHKLMYAPAKLPAYEYEYADLDEQYGLEPDTVKAYNIDGGLWVCLYVCSCVSVTVCLFVCS